MKYCRPYGEYGVIQRTLCLETKGSLDPRAEGAGMILNFGCKTFFVFYAATDSQRRTFTP